MTLIASAPRVAGRLLSDYAPLMGFFCRAEHGTATVVGYVVRETIRGGQRLIDGPTGRVGHDRFTVEGSTNYADTFPFRDSFRNERGGYAVVDNLYACGCRYY